MRRPDGRSRRVFMGLGLATSLVAGGGCSDTTADLSAVHPGMTKLEVTERLGDGIPQGDLPAELLDHLPACHDARYYQSEYKARLARNILGEPAAQSYWRICFDHNVVTSTAGLGIITRAKS